MKEMIWDHKHICTAKFHEISVMLVMHWTTDDQLVTQSQIRVSHYCFLVTLLSSETYDTVKMNGTIKENKECGGQEKNHSIIPLMDAQWR